VTYARTNSWQAEKRPMAPSPGASLPLDASLLSIVANLEGLDLDGVRRQWRAHLGGEAPVHLSRWFPVPCDAAALADFRRVIGLRSTLRIGRRDDSAAVFAWERCARLFWP
jgi:hypothetical protein